MPNFFHIPKTLTEFGKRPGPLFPIVGLDTRDTVLINLGGSPFLYRPYFVPPSSDFNTDSTSVMLQECNDEISDYARYLREHDTTISCDCSEEELESASEENGDEYHPEYDDQAEDEEMHRRRALPFLRNLPPFPIEMFRAFDFTLGDEEVLFDNLYSSSDDDISNLVNYTEDYTL
jgi:hypothetical protein